MCGRMYVCACNNGTTTSDLLLPSFPFSSFRFAFSSFSYSFLSYPSPSFYSLSSFFFFIPLFSPFPSRSLSSPCETSFSSVPNSSSPSKPPLSFILLSLRTLVCLVFIFFSYLSSSSSCLNFLYLFSFSSYRLFILHLRLLLFLSAPVSPYFSSSWSCHLSSRRFRKHFALRHGTTTYLNLVTILP